MTKEANNEIAEYSVTTAALAKLKTELSGKKYAVDNATGMALAKFDRRGLVTLRTDLEKKRKEIKAPALAHCALIDNEAKRITLELRELEDPIDAQIKAQEEIEEAKRLEKAAIAAAAQKVLDDKIAEIGKLPLRCIGQTSDEITLFIAALDARPFGGEFTGETLARAEAAKEEAITAIRDMLAATVKAEEAAAVAKAEAEVAAAYEEQKRLERESAEKIQREANEKLQAELTEQKRVQDIEAARLKKLADDESARLAGERARFEAEKAEAEKKQAEDNRIAAEKQEAIDSENKRISDEAAAAQREIDRQAAIVAEQSRKDAEVKAKAAEKARKLAEAKCKDAATAFKKILDICNGLSVPQADMLVEIALICEAMTI